MQKIIYSFFLIFISANSFSYQPKENYTASHTPSALENLKIVEKLGETLDTNLQFKDENSKTITLSQYFNNLPVLLTIIYYNCPSLCNFHLNGLFDSLEEMSLKSGKDYEFVVVSMDHKETPDLAKEKKQAYLKKYKNHLPNGVHFLTGSEKNIASLASQVGFRFRWDDETKQYAHSPVAYLISPDQVISRYLYGVMFESQTLKMSLVESSQGKIGDIVDRVLLFCYRFNPKKNKYTLYSYNIMRLAGLLTVLILLSILGPIWLKEIRK